MTLGDEVTAAEAWAEEMFNAALAKVTDDSGAVDVARLTEVMATQVEELLAEWAQRFAAEATPEEVEQMAALRSQFEFMRKYPAGNDSVGDDVPVGDER